MGVNSGKYGVVNGQSGVQNWTINETSASKTARASNTKGGTARRKGPRDWTGSFMSFDSVPLLMPGETFTFTGYTAPTTPPSGVGVTYTGPAIVDSIVVTINFATGDLISATVNFSANGELAESTGTITDASTPDFQSACDGLGIFIWDGTEETEIEDVVSFTFTITSSNQSYVNSSTNCHTQRKPGTIDWTGSMVVQNHSRVSMPLDIDDQVWLRVYVTATTYWSLKWTHVKDITGIGANRDTGAIITATYVLEMNGNSKTDGAIGEIKLPGAGSAWWPFLL